MAYERMQNEGPQMILPTHAPTQRHHPALESHKKTIRWLGIVETVLGSLMAILAFATLVIAGSFRAHYHYMFTFVSQGLWGGIFVISNGVLGTKFFSNPTACLCNSSMALSIVSSVILSVVISLSGYAVASIDHWNYLADPLIALHVVIGIIGFVGLVFCIVHSVYCCRCVCHSLPYGEIYVTTFPQQQAASLNPNVQLMMVPHQNTAIGGHHSAETPACIPQVLQYPPGSLALPQTTFVNPEVTYPTMMPSSTANQTPIILESSSQPIGVHNPCLNMTPATASLPPYRN